MDAKKTKLQALGKFPKSNVKTAANLRSQIQWYLALEVDIKDLYEIAELSGGPLPSCEQPRNWPDGGRCARRPRPNPLLPHWQPPCFCKADAGLAQEAIAMIRGNPSQISRALRGWEQEATEFTQVVQGLQ